jgi:hypothetical protein
MYSETILRNGTLEISFVPQQYSYSFALSAQKSLARNHMPVVPHPPNSPDLVWLSCFQTSVLVKIAVFWVVALTL